MHRPLIAAFTGGGPEAEELSAQMQEAWLAFARSGDPSHDAIGQWPTWAPTVRSTMVFGKETGVVDGPRNEELAVWSAHPRWPARYQRLVKGRRVTNLGDRFPHAP